MPDGLRGIVLQAELLASDVSAGHIATTEQCLQRLILGGVQICVVSVATAADEVLHKQQLLAKHQLPEGITIVTSQPKVLAICLRATATQMSLAASAVAYAAVDSQEASAACRTAGVHLLPFADNHSAQHLSQLLNHIADSHRRHSQALVVGYTMKPSRERNLASRGLLPLTAPHGMCFVPIDFARPLEQQGTFDITLHKATDELISRGPLQLPYFSARIASLASYTRAHPHTLLVDPLEKVQQVIDRQTLTRCLEEATAAAQAQGFPVQTPPSVQVDRLGPDAETRHLLAHSGIRLPCIVKPRVACGTPEAHEMAVVLHEAGFQTLQPTWSMSVVKPSVACGAPETHEMAVLLHEAGFQTLQVSLPGCVQQFINHSSVLYKVYVIGDQMHVAQRQSIPNLPAAPTQAASLPPVIAFDSLKSLPQRDYLQPHYESQQTPPGSSLRSEVVQIITEALRRKLELTLFGYDIVVEDTTGVHFIIDVNYFPSYKEFPDAAKALSEVLKTAWHKHRQGVPTPYDGQFK